MQHRRRELLLIFVTGVLATLLGMLTPQATAWMMDEAIPDANRKLLFELALGLGAAAVGQTLFSVAQSIVILRVSVRSQADIQGALWDRLLRLRPSFFRKYSSGDLQSRVSTVSQVGQELNGATLTGCFSGFISLMNLGLLYYYSSTLAFIAVGIVLVTVVSTAVASFFIRRLASGLMEQQGQLFGFVVQIVQGVGKIQVAGAQRRAFTQWVERYTGQLRLSLRIQRIEDWMIVLNQVLPPAGTICLFWFASQPARARALSDWRWMRSANVRTPRRAIQVSIGPAIPPPAWRQAFTRSSRSLSRVAIDPSTTSECPEVDFVSEVIVASAPRSSGC